MKTGTPDLQSPSWFADAIVYHILVDRFAGYDPEADWKKPRFMGGNLKGIISRIPYLTDLGINTLWLSPVFKTTAYHGYHVTDFYSTDKRFGSTDDLKELIARAHQNNLRVILDFVPNHCSVKHPYFREALGNRHSPYRKWFYFNNFNDNYRCFLHHRDLPKFNLDFGPARDHVTGAARYWLSLGIDGFRLDHAIGPSHRFWRHFRQEVKTVNPEALLIAEAWLEGIGFNMLNTISVKHKYLRWLFRFNPWNVVAEYAGEMDGALDFHFRQRITEYIAWKEDPEPYEEKLQRVLHDFRNHFPEHFYLPTFVDNHDMNRFLFDAGQNREKLRQALQLQFSLPQPPILYYGTETGLSHDAPVNWDIPFSDIQARRPMPWKHLDHDLIGFCRELIQRRRVLSGSR
jgi:glycosidase